MKISPRNLRPGGAQLDVLDRDHAGNPRDGRAQPVGQPLRGAVGERSQRFPAEPEAGIGDEQRDAHGRQRVALPESVGVGDQADQHQRRADQIGGEMHGVGGERLAAGLFRHRAQGEEPPAVHHDGDHQHAIGPPRGLHGLPARAQPPHGCEQHVDREPREQPGLYQRRERFELAVAVMVAFVGGLVGLAHREEGEDGGAGVDGVVRGFRQQRQRTRRQPRRRLSERQQGADHHGAERDLFLEGGVFGHVSLAMSEPRT